jgi:Tfp pilus assembly protein PilV
MMKKIKGFTLLEVLIFFCIISIILAIALPQMCSDKNVRNITLYSNEWTCTRSENKTLYRPYKSDKGDTYEIIPASECIEYKKN